MEPEHPSNKTLRYWQDYNISASDVPWGNLTVSVSEILELYLCLCLYLLFCPTAVNILEKKPHVFSDHVGSAKA